MRGNELQRAFERTLAYSTVFHSPLQFWQFHSYLLSPVSFSYEELRQFWKERSEKYGEKIAIPSLDVQLQEHKWRETQQALRWFRYIPWISSVWVTGSLAIKNISEDDDLDFLIITKEKRLWITRAMVVILGILLGKIRLRGHNFIQSRDRWCCNLWLEESDLDLSDDKSLYTARELVQAWPIYQAKQDAAVEFILQNTWVKQYTRLGWLTAYERAKHLIPRSPLTSFIPSISLVNSHFGNTINFLFFRLQFWYMNFHRREEKVNYTRAFFHPVERSTSLATEYERIVKYFEQKYGRT